MDPQAYKAVIDYQASKAMTLLAMETIKEYLKSDAPLDERWGVYLQIEDDLPCSISCDMRGLEEDLGKEQDSMCAYDDLGIERHQEIAYSTIVENFQEDSAVNSDEYKQSEKEFCELHTVTAAFKAEPYLVFKEWHATACVKYGLPLPLFKESVLQCGDGKTMDDH